MSDGIAPAIDKVGAPEPTAPEAQAGAPTMDTAKPNVVVDPPAPSETPEAAPALGAPKPVEVMSVPETPVGGTTPASGSPRPELTIPMETNEAEEPRREEPVVMTEVQGPLPTPTASLPNSDAGPNPVVDKSATSNGHVKAGALEAEQTPEATEIIVGEKRKLEGPPVDEPSAEKEESDESERADKKAKVDSAGEGNGGAPPRGRPGRPRKDKSAPQAAGRTARKTRSQGPVEI